MVIEVVQRDIPPYFERTCRNAANLWEQLENNQELAGPWRQLFIQIQSPRHVLSELLQNADDAGATSAEVRIEDGMFIFEHDGEDFTEEQFASLCRFGFSNKRHLHTIGFRGIGFKSTFSLGDTVEINTPTLSVCFHRKRFTEPVWVKNGQASSLTRISVRLRDDRVTKEIEKSFAEWANSTLSLLFFKNVRSLTISGKKITCVVLGRGPVKGSKKIKLISGDEHEVVKFVSPLADFPDDALEEIRQERMAIDPDFSLPPCSVEIVVGISGPQHLYVVLPTDTQTKIPFSINAPFVQDPARMGIKDPSISPTNRWLLERVGRFAAECMMGWLGNEKYGLSKRSEAYCLLPPRLYTFDGCDSYICSAISDFLNKRPILIASDGSLTKRCFVPPYLFYEIWDPDQIVTFAGDGYDAVLCQNIQPPYRDRLQRWGFIRVYDGSEIFEWFDTHTVPRPAEYDQIVQLWEYILENRPIWINYAFGSFRVVPAEGMDTLSSAENLVRIGDSIRGLSEEDADFLSEYLCFVDRSFLRVAGEWLKNPNSKRSRVVSKMFSRINLEKDSSAKVLIEKAYSQLDQKYDHEKLIRFAHIAGILNAEVPNDFYYVNRKGECHFVSHGLALDASGRLEELLPQDYGRSHLLHEDYLGGQDPDKRKQWIVWSETQKSGLNTFVGITERSKEIYSKHKLFEWLQTRGGKKPEEFPLQSDSFVIEDYVFEPVIVDHLTTNFPDNGQRSVWTEIFALIAVDPSNFWKEKLQARCLQRGKKKNHALSCGNIHASWLRHLSSTRCLLDTDGSARKPDELLMRNAKTEALMGVEPFVGHKYDTSELHDLLIALGVRYTAGSPDAILDRIRIFAGHENPPEYELIKLYERLDGLLKHCTPQEIIKVKSAFEDHQMIYTQEGVWACPQDVFRTIPGGEMGGIFRVLSTLRDLPLWNLIGVEYEPTMDILIGYLKRLEYGSPVKSFERDRIRMVLSRAPHRVWREIGHWLGVDAVWKPISSFSYYLSQNVAGGAEGLFPLVKAKTVDLRMVDYNEVDALVADSGLKDLQSTLSLQVFNFKESGSCQEKRPWMETLGKLLKRVQVEDVDGEQATREIGARLSETVWITVSDLVVMPYLGGSPAGKEQRPDVFWDDRVLYIREMSPGRLLKVVPTELKRSCSMPSVGDAIVRCYDRSPEIIIEYCEENFTLLPEAEVPTEYRVTSSHEMSSGSDPETGILHIAGDDQACNSNVEPQPVLDLEEDVLDPEEDVLDPEEDVLDPEEDQPKIPSRQPSNGNRARYRNLIEIFSEKQRYTQNPNTGRFVHPDGSWIQKGGEPFHWEMRSSKGSVLERLWVHEGKLSRGIEMPAEVWGMIEKNPEKSAILLRAEDDGADVISGTALLAGIKHEDLGLFPAKYRLRRIFE